MDSTVVAAGVAVVGVIGSAVVTSWISGRSRVQDFELRTKERIEERESEDHQRRLSELRLCYVTLNRSAREYLSAMSTHRHRLTTQRPESLDDPDDLARARHGYGVAFSEAQLMVSAEVLVRASAVNRRLATSYGVLKRLERGREDSGEDTEALGELIEGCWGLIKEMRNQMRRELGP